MITTDVLIVGSGPAGGAASLFLSTYGIDYRRTLGQIIASNTNQDESADNVFLVDEDDLPAPACSDTVPATAPTGKGCSERSARRFPPSRRAGGWSMER